MKILGMWVAAVLAALGGAWLAGAAGGSGVVTVSTFFCLLMLAWCVIYRPWTL